MIIGITIALLALSAATPLYASTLYDTATAYWSFQDGTGNSDGNTYTPSWLTGSPNYGTNPPVSIADGRIGKGMDFIPSGSPAVPPSDYLNYSSSNLNVGNGNFTLTTWVKIDSVRLQTIIGRVVWGGNEWGIYQQGDGKFVALIGNYQQWGESVSNSAYQGGWVHLAVVRNDSLGAQNIVLYVNGQSQTDTSSWHQAINSDSGASNTFMMGRRMYNSNTGHYLDGQLDEAALWNSAALTGDQIDALYKEAFIYDALKTGGAFNLGYDTDKANQLAALYAAKTGTVTIGADVWRYIDHDNPMWDTYGTRTVGETFTVNGVKYLYLGGGLGNGDPPGVPEPAGVGGLISVLLIIGLRRMRRR